MMQPESERLALTGFSPVRKAAAHVSHSALLVVLMAESALSLQQQDLTESLTHVDVFSGVALPDDQLQLQENNTTTEQSFERLTLWV